MSNPNKVKVSSWNKASKSRGFCAQPPRKSRHGSIYESARTAAIAWLRDYDGDFKFLVDMKKLADKPGVEFSWKQLEAIERCQVFRRI